MKIKIGFLLFFLSVPLLLVSCSAPVKKVSAEQSIVTSCRIGFDKLFTGDFQTAETEFLKALQLDNTFFLGYTGMAFLELQRADNSSSIRYSDKAIEACPDSAEAYAIKAAAIAAMKKGSKWKEKAGESINIAIALNPENQMVLYCEGVYYFETGKYQHAFDSFDECAGKSGGLSKKAEEMKLLTGKLMTALPVTEHGLKIVKKTKINRADMAVLLIEELKIKQLLKKYRPELFKILFNDELRLKSRKRIKIDSDTIKGKMRISINETAAIDIPYINLLPDGKFYPERTVTKANFAAIAEGVTVMLNDNPAISSLYSGQSSEFSDVNSGYYAFNAIRFTIDKGIMESPSGGVFNPDSDISGVEALLMIRSLGKLFNE